MFADETPPAGPLAEYAERLLHVYARANDDALVFRMQLQVAF